MFEHVEVLQKLLRAERRGDELGLSDEEIAFL
jgi:hypothetical protein